MIRKFKNYVAKEEYSLDWHLKHKLDFNFKNNEINDLKKDLNAMISFTYVFKSLLKEIEGLEKTLNNINTVEDAKQNLNKLEKLQNELHKYETNLDSLYKSFYNIQHTTGKFALGLESVLSIIKNN